MRVWRIFLWYFFWCCASVALLVLSQAIYPWVWMIERRNAGPHEERLIRTEELCARDNPLRSQVASFDCDKWEKSQAELKQKVKELARVQERAVAGSGSGDRSRAAQARHDPGARDWRVAQSAGKKIRCQKASGSLPAFKIAYRLVT